MAPILYGGYFELRLFRQQVFWRQRLFRTLAAR